MSKYDKMHKTTLRIRQDQHVRKKAAKGINWSARYRELLDVELENLDRVQKVTTRLKSGMYRDRAFESATLAADSYIDNYAGVEQFLQHQSAQEAVTLLFQKGERANRKLSDEYFDKFDAWQHFWDTLKDFESADFFEMHVQPFFEWKCGDVPLSVAPMYVRGLRHRMEAMWSQIRNDVLDLEER